MKSVWQAYHKNRACIIYKPDIRDYVFVVLDKDLMNKPLSDLAKQRKAK